MGVLVNNAKTLLSWGGVSAVHKHNIIDLEMAGKILTHKLSDPDVLSAKLNELLCANMKLGI